MGITEADSDVPRAPDEFCVDENGRKMKGVPDITSKANSEIIIFIVLCPLHKDRRFSFHRNRKAG